MEHRISRRVQFYETDAAGIVHFSWYFRYMEEAEHAFWRSVGLSVAAPGSEIGWPRVAATFDYERALQFEDEFEVALRVDALTKKTIRYACRLTKDGQPIGSGTLTVACVRKSPGDPMRAIEIPRDILVRLGAAPDAPS
jgi:acyl-CoA thioester hydrolase